VNLEFLPWTAPAPGAAVEAAAGVRWMRLPVPGSLAHINIWHAPGREGRVLIDTGMNQPDTRAAWEGLAAAEGLDSALSAILVTHHHPDHFGMAGHLAARFGVRVRMSAPARAAALRSLAPLNGASAAALEDYRDTWGVDFEALLGSARATGTREQLLSGMPEAGAAITEGETLPELRDPWVASIHFGHADGHVCLHWPEGALFIGGDQLLPAISSNVSLYPGLASRDPLGDFLASLERLEQLPPDTIVLPAHGQPFRGAAARVAQLRAGHAQRLAKLTDFTAVPRTTPEVVTALFGTRNLEGWNRLLAFGETLAHIRYLYGRGGIARLAEAGEVRWQRS
jgi:glyoxylase-like metal-dependent hydrolase (beta-lactamase superfamily II)